MIFLNEYFQRNHVTPSQLDGLLAQGWRHFGTEFFRYSRAVHDGQWCSVQPLRIDLTQFSLSRSQKRALAKNQELEVVIRDSFVDEIKEAMFERHRQRFRSSRPESLFTFLSDQPSSIPCVNQELCFYAGRELLAVSFLDLGDLSTSAVYAMFEPAEAKRSLGILAILAGIRYSQELGCRYYYPGYAYREPSIYDYKKNFSGLQYLDWQTGWQPHEHGLPLQSLEKCFE